MATVRHLGLTPSGCPVTVSSGYPWMSLQNAVAAYWRVKKWKLEVVAGWEIAGQGSTFLSFEMQKTGLTPFKYISEAWRTPFGGGDFFLALSSYFGDDPQNETHLVCDPPDLQLLDPEQEALSGAARFFYTGIGEPATSDSITTEIILTSNIVYNSENELFAPSISYNGRTFRWVTISSSPFLTTNPTYGEYGTFNLKMLGQTFSSPIFAINNRGGNVMDINVTLEAEEYWPYDPGDGGGPIYDSATGEQLRPFPA
jgi:hypothetical protein